MPDATNDSRKPATIWPPPPNVPPTESVPFKNIRLGSMGSVSDFRVGTVSVLSDGVTITGLAVPPFRTQYWILLTAFLTHLVLIVLNPYLFFLQLWLVAAIVLECAFRRPMSLVIAWNDIDQIAFIPDKSQVCIVYRMHDSGNLTRRYSLPTGLDSVHYAEFDKAVEAYAPSDLRISVGGRLTYSHFSSPDDCSLITGWLMVAAAYGLATVLHHGH